MSQPNWYKLDRERARAADALFASGENHEEEEVEEDLDCSDDLAPFTSQELLDELARRNVDLTEITRDFAGEDADHDYKVRSL